MTSGPPWTADNDHVDALRGSVERGGVGQVADDQLGATGRERIEHVLVALEITDEQPDASIGLL